MISIIIPIYNSQQFLRECFNSILHQTHRDFEVILVNDGSTDNSKSICLEYCDRDSRFKYIEQSNSGVSAARNTGLDTASGDYIVFVDSDDEIAPDYLDSLHNNIGGCDMSNCNLSFNKEKLGTGDKIFSQYNAKQIVEAYQTLSMRNLGITCSLFKKGIIDKVHLRFVVGCYVNEDTEFVLKYVANCSTIVVSQYIGYYYREVDTSAMHRLSEKSLTSIEATKRIEKYLWERGLVERPNYLIEAGVMNYIFKSAISRNREIFEYLHSQYDIRKFSKKMFRYPKFRRKIVSICYYFMGKHVFWMFGEIGNWMYSVYTRKYQ